MTEAELLAALEAATQRAPGGQGITVAEIVQATGASETRIRKVIAAGLKAGRVKRASKLVDTISGRIMPIPSYLFIPEE